MLPVLSPVRAARLLLQARARALGGPGSGNFGHAGRPGYVGGSASSDDGSYETADLLNKHVEIKVPGGRMFLEPMSAEGYLNIFTVGVDVHKQGTGAQLYLAALKEAHKRGLKGVSSLVSSRNSAADAVWNSLERRGARIERGVTIEKGTFAGSKIDVLLSAGNLRLSAFAALGGPGSGNFGHAGRPGEVGGSASMHQGATVSHIGVPAGIDEAIQKADGGFTYHAVTGKVPTTGYALSLHQDREQILDAKDVNVVTLAAYVKKNRELLSRPNNYFGGWHNPEDDKIYLDVSTVVDSPEEAERLGTLAKQYAYYDLASGKSVKIEGRRYAFPKVAAAFAGPDWSQVRGPNPRRHYRARAKIDWTRTDRRGNRTGTQNSWRVAGGPGSGNFGHAGRPGHVGGSSKGEGSGEPAVAVPALVAYHGTTDQAWRAIQKEGLVPHKGKGADVIAGAPEYVIGGPGSPRRASVYISDDPRIAASFADFVARKQGMEALILEIRIPKDQAWKVVGDTQLETGLRFNGTIPPEWIRRTELPVDKLKRPMFMLAEENKEIVVYAVVAVRKRRLVTAGGSGSGNFGHAGRPGEIGGSSKTVYHGTAEGSLKTILREGLLAKHAREVWDTTKPGHVFVTTKFDAAKNFAQHAANSLSGGGFIATPAVLRIEVPDEFVSRFRPDDFVGQNLVGEAFEFEGDIPPEWIKGAWTREGPFKHDWDNPKPWVKVLAGNRTFYVAVVLKQKQRNLGGPGSGNFGHAGRPGEVGGSASSSGAGVAEDTGIRQNTSASEMRAKERPANLQAAEDRIRHEAHEHGYAFREDGVVLYSGDNQPNAVALQNVPDRELGTSSDPYLNAVFTHNHPGGSGLSINDVYVAAAHNMREMRAVSSDGYTYSAVRVGNQWPNAETLVSIASGIDKEVHREFVKKIGEGTLTIREAEQKHWSEVWRRVAKVTDLTGKRINFWTEKVA